jgi:xanthosine utilization system XapX-like protein
MKAVLRDLLSSKKCLAAIAGVGVILLNKLLSIDMPEEDLLKVLGMIATYIVGQGVADFGKEKAKVEHTAKALTAIKGTPRVVVEQQYPPTNDVALVDLVARNRGQIKKILAD